TVEVDLRAHGGQRNRGPTTPGRSRPGTRWRAQAGSVSSPPAQRRDGETAVGNVRCPTGRPHRKRGSRPFRANRGEELLEVTGQPLEMLRLSRQRETQNRLTVRVLGVLHADEGLDLQKLLGASVLLHGKAHHLRQSGVVRRTALPAF